MDVSAAYAPHSLNHDSPASIRSFLAARDLAPRKRWGQNFLINPGAREKILNLLAPGAGMHVWEIGPGLGAMSRAIIDRGAGLKVFEIDPAYCEWLREYLAGEDFELVQGDVTRTWKREWSSRRPDAVLGNLPYNAASAIIAMFIESDALAPRNVFTVQDEMGRRMTAAPSTADYSSFSVLCQTTSAVRDGGKLAPGSFYPVPRVNSRIVVIEPSEPFGPISDPSAFRLLVRSLFSSRRKTLANNITFSASRPGFPPVSAVRDAFDAEGIDLSRRPETVPPAAWVALANRIAAGR